MPGDMKNVKARYNRITYKWNFNICFQNTRYNGGCCTTIHMHRNYQKMKEDKRDTHHPHLRIHISSLLLTASTSIISATWYDVASYRINFFSRNYVNNHMIDTQIQSSQSQKKLYHLIPWHPRSMFISYDSSVHDIHAFLIILDILEHIIG